MTVAVISDIHSNITALKAVLDDIKKRGIKTVICAGDLVGYAPFPNEVIELIREQKIPTVMGNYDDGVGFDRLICGCDYPDEKAQALGEQSIKWTKEHTTNENKEFLRGLPEKLEFTAGPYQILLVHGSPRRLNEYLYETTPEEVLREIYNGIAADILIVGHTHKPYHRIIDGKHIINPGSVGKPKHGDPCAVYCLINFDAKVEVEFIKVPYNVDCVARAIEESGLPNEFANMLKEGWG